MSPQLARYTASSCKISLKADNRLLSYGHKTIFKMEAVRHLEFLKFYIWSRDCHWVWSVLLCAKFHQWSKSDDFSFRYGVL